MCILVRIACYLCQNNALIPLIRIALTSFILPFERKDTNCIFKKKKKIETMVIFWRQLKETIDSFETTTKKILVL